MTPRPSTSAASLAMSHASSPLDQKISLSLLDSTTISHSNKRKSAAAAVSSSAAPSTTTTTKAKRQRQTRIPEHLKTVKKSSTPPASAEMGQRRKRGRPRKVQPVVTQEAQVESEAARLERERAELVNNLERSGYVLVLLASSF
jgi:hypothetical protein